MDQHSSMKTVIISLSAIPQETLTIYTPLLLGKHAPFTQPIRRQCENRCKRCRKTEILLDTVLGLSSQDGWRSSCSQRETNIVCAVWRLKSTVQSRTDQTAWQRRERSARFTQKQYEMERWEKRMISKTWHMLIIMSTLLTQFILVLNIKLKMLSNCTQAASELFGEIER